MIYPASNLKTYPTQVIRDAGHVGEYVDPTFRIRKVGLAILGAKDDVIEQLLVSGHLL